MQVKSFALIFPGQGSQSVGMGKLLAETFPRAKEIFLQADDLLGVPLTRLIWSGPESELNDTINTQPALLVHSIAVLEVFRSQYPDFVPSFVAGHSMGELSALVAAGSLPFGKALELVRKRGELMKEAGERSPGGMAAVLGLNIPTLEGICSRASSGSQIVQVANDNCPGQVVISGAEPALERAVQYAQQEGARRVRRLAVSIAAHSPLMNYAQKEFTLAVERSPIVDPVVPLIGNVTALPLRSHQDIRQDLCAQLTSRVRWTESIQTMVANGVNAFFELGNASVLTGLLKRIDPQVIGISIGSPSDFEKINHL